MFHSSGDGYVGALLELHKGCQGPFQGSRGKVGFLSRRHSRKRPHVALRGEFPGFSQGAAGNLGFLSSYEEYLRDPLIASRMSSLHASCEGPLRIPLQSVQGPRSSSRFKAGSSGFLCSADMDLRDPMEFQQGSQVSSHVETC